MTEKEERGVEVGVWVGVDAGVEVWVGRGVGVLVGEGVSVGSAVVVGVTSVASLVGLGVWVGDGGRKVGVASGEADTPSLTDVGGCGWGACVGGGCVGGGCVAGGRVGGGGSLVGNGGALVESWARVGAVGGQAATGRRMMQTVRIAATRTACQKKPGKRWGSTPFILCLITL